MTGLKLNFISMAMQNSPKVKIATYNVNGVLNPIKRSKILSKLKQDKIHRRVHCRMV